MHLNRNTIKDLLSNLAVFSLPLSMVSVLYFIAYGAAEPLLWVLVAPFLLMYVVRKKVQRLVPFIVLHILIIVIAGFLIGDRYSNWFVWVFLAATGAMSGWLKTREEINLGRIFAAVSTIIMVGLFLLLTFAQADPAQMQMQMVVVFIAAQILNVVFCHMDNVDYRLDVLSKINGYADPSNRVLAANNKLIAIFTIGTFSIAMLLLFGAGLWRWITILIAELSAAFSRFGGIFINTMEGHYHSPPDVPNWDIPEDANLNYFFEQVEEVLGHLEHDQLALHDQVNLISNIIGIVLIAIIVFALTRWFYKKFYKKRKQKQEETPVDTVIALEKNIVGDIINLLPRFKPKYRHPVRRAYAKKVNRYIKNGVPISRLDTTDIIGNKIGVVEDISELTAKYENVRYGR